MTVEQQFGVHSEEKLPDLEKLALLELGVNRELLGELRKMSRQGGDMFEQALERQHLVRTAGRDWKRMLRSTVNRSVSLEEEYLKFLEEHRRQGCLRSNTVIGGVTPPIWALDVISNQYETKGGKLFAGCFVVPGSLLALFGTIPGGLLLDTWGALKRMQIRTRLDEQKEILYRGAVDAEAARELESLLQENPYSSVNNGAVERWLRYVRETLRDKEREVRNETPSRLDSLKLAFWGGLVGSELPRMAKKGILPVTSRAYPIQYLELVTANRVGIWTRFLMEQEQLAYLLDPGSVKEEEERHVDIEPRSLLPPLQDLLREPIEEYVLADRLEEIYERNCELINSIDMARLSSERERARLCSQRLMEREQKIKLGLEDYPDVVLGLRLTYSPNAARRTIEERLGAAAWERYSASEAER